MSITLPDIKHPFKGVGKKIESITRKAIFDFSMLKYVKALAVALSGGKDSLCLLYMLKAILDSSYKDIKLIAIHIDGDYSCGASFDRNYLQKLCENLDVKIYFKELKKKLNELNCYSCSRLRRKLIFEIAKENNIDTIAYGHHRDDNIQTLLLNLFHIGEFEGMLPKISFQRYSDIKIIRPLIYVEEDKILSFAKQNSILKAFCKCPLGQNSKRKEIKKLIQEIEKDNFSNIKKNLSKASFLYGSKKALFID